MYWVVAQQSTKHSHQCFPKLGLILQMRPNSKKWRNCPSKLWQNTQRRTQGFRNKLSCSIIAHQETKCKSLNSSSWTIYSMSSTSSTRMIMSVWPSWWWIPRRASDSLRKITQVWRMWQLVHWCRVKLFLKTMIFIWFPSSQIGVQWSPTTIRWFLVTQSWKKESYSNSSTANASTMWIGPAPLKFLESFSTPKNVQSSPQKL